MTPGKRHSDSREIRLESAKDEENDTSDDAADDQALFGGRSRHVRDERDETAEEVREADRERRDVES